MMRWSAWIVGAGGDLGRDGREWRGGEGLQRGGAWR